MAKKKKKKKNILLILIVILFIIAIIIFAIKKSISIKEEEERISEIEEGWYIEVITDYINTRSDSSSYSTKLGKIKKGEVYPALECTTTSTSGESSSYYWYKIQLEDGSEVWVANPKSARNGEKGYLIDHNNPNDIAKPYLSFKEDVYKVNSINDINYNHLELWDDKDDYKVTHVVYHEYRYCDGTNINCEPKDQYWIKYTITDGVGNSVSKTQKIEFKNTPSESEVKDFYKEYK
jgi:hypothetical protein